MARYTGPKTRICRIFGEPILGNGKYLTKNSNPPGQHGPTRKRKAPGEYALQLKEKDKAKESLTGAIRGKNQKFGWLDWNESEMKGTFVAYPERESVPENIKEQLIVELYSK